MALEGIALLVAKVSTNRIRARMSAPLSSTASINVESDKATTRVSPWSSDPDSDLENPDSSARHSDSGAQVMSVRDCSKVLGANPIVHLQPIRLLVVDESDQVRQMCCEAAEGFGFVAVEAGTIHMPWGKLLSEQATRNVFT